MANWLTQTNLTNALGTSTVTALTDDTNDPPTTINTAVVAEIISDVESEVAAALIARYPTQVAARTASPTITRICKALAIRDSYLRRQDMSVNQNLVSVLDRMVDLFEKLASGERDVPEWTADDAISTTPIEFPSDQPDTMVDWLNDRTEYDE